jgi:hypothetical protein
VRPTVGQGNNQGQQIWDKWIKEEMELNHALEQKRLDWCTKKMKGLQVKKEDTLKRRFRDHSQGTDS